MLLFGCGFVWVGETEREYKCAVEEAVPESGTCMSLLQVAFSCTTVYSAGYFLKQKAYSLHLVQKIFCLALME